MRTAGEKEGMGGSGGSSGHRDDGDGPGRGRTPGGRTGGKPDRTGPAGGTPAVLDPAPSGHCVAGVAEGSG